MTIIEQINAEIESRKKSLRAGICNEEVFTRKQRKEMLVASEEFDRLNRFLSTLEEKSEKPMQEGLEEEIATYLKDWEDDEEIGLHLSTDNGCITIELDDIRDLARHFAQWQKEQMMKEAVEGTVYGNGVYTWVAGDIPSQFKYGDKVRIIIVKE